MASGISPSIYAWRKGLTGREALQHGLDDKGIAGKVREEKTRQRDAKLKQQGRQARGLVVPSECLERGRVTGNAAKYIAAQPEPAQ